MRRKQIRIYKEEKMKALTQKAFGKALLAILLALALVLPLALTIRPFSAMAEEGAGDAQQHTLTIDLNGGERLVEDVRNGDDVTYRVAGDVKLTHETVRAMFGNISPFMYDENGKYLSDEKDGKDQPKYAGPLLYGLFVDADADGALDDGERLYVSGDTLPVDGDMTLTCYYSNNGVQYSTATAWGMEVNTYVSIARGWPEDKIPTKKSNDVKYSYTARQLQPLYMQVGAVADGAFRCTTDEGNWCDAVVSVELPNTTQVIGYQAFMGQFGMTEIKGLESVYGIDAEAFMNTHVQELVFADLNYIAHYSMIMDVTSAKLIVEKWQNDKTPAWYAQNRMVDSNPTPWFGGNSISKDTAGFVIYVPHGKTAEWYTADPNNQLKVSYGDKWNAEGGEDKAAYDASTDNIPMREFYTVSFDLNGADGYIANEHQDAGAASVLVDGQEVNITDDSTGLGWNENGDARTRTKNPADQDISLLYVEKPEDPVMDGKLFAGWMDEDGTVWTESDFGPSGKVLEGDVKLTAQWADVVTLTLNKNNGEEPVEMFVADGAALSASALTDPVKEGYVFMGWYKDSSCETAWSFDEDVVNGDTELYAGYIARSYDITYHLNDGTAGAGAPDEYTIEDAVTLVAPTREGYTFAGWFDNEACEGTAVTSITAGSTGDKEFWAKWTANTPVDPDPVDPGPVDPGPVDPTPTDPTPTDPGTTEPEPADEGGCGSSVVGVSIVGAAVAISAAAVAVRKRRN